MSMPFEPFQGNPRPRVMDGDPRSIQDVPPPWGPGHPKGRYGAPPDFTVPAKKVWGVWNLVAAAVGYVAGRNHYRNGESGLEAVNKGVHAYARWMAWSVSLFIWGLCFMFFALGGSFNPASDWAGIVACTLVWPFVFGVTWCRYVDFCLFRHGLWYRLFQPIDAACDKIPTPMLYLGMLLPLGALTL